MQNYKDLNVWKKAHALVLHVYELTIGFPKTEQFNLTSQLRRAATSIPANVAEGCGKFTQSDFANFLQTALGSSNEVEYLSLLSRDLGSRCRFVRRFGNPGVRSESHAYQPYHKSS